MRACIFCAIVARESPGRIVYEDDTILGFLDAVPATPGHTLLVPKQHVVDIWSTSDELASSIAIATLRVSALIRERLAPAGLNVLQSNGASAGQDVMHLHVHVVPRYPNDDLRRTWWSPDRTPEGDLDALAVRLTGTD